jgi:hypothetical protein
VPVNLGLAETTVSIVVACISGVIALTALGWQVVAESRRQRREHEFTVAQQQAVRRVEAEQLVRRYREPLVYAADQLLNRIENIRDNAFLEKYGTTRREYVVRSTAYAIAELLCWMELFRENQQFLDLGEEQATREMNRCLAAVGRTLSTDTIVDASDRPAAFMLWRQQQRAIGELMIERSEGQAHCIGYATFGSKLDDPSFASWFAAVLGDAATSVDEPARAMPRLDELARATTSLIDHLDPNRVRALER